MDDGLHATLLRKAAKGSAQSLPIPDIHLVMNKLLGQRFFQSALIPPGISLGAKEDCALIIIHSMNFPSLFCKIDADFGPD